MIISKNKVSNNLSVLSAVAAGIFWFCITARASGEITVIMNDGSFTPQVTEVSAGDIVIFKNAGSEDRWPASNIHPTHEIYPEFDPQKPILPGQSWSFKFDKVGSWKFHDHLDPRLVGTINVVAENNPAEKEGSDTNIFQETASWVKTVFKKLLLLFKKEKVPKIDKGSTEIFKSRAALKTYIQNYGTKETIKRLHALSAQFGTCHDVAHVAGRTSYELFGEKSFKECSAECHSGCYHGATEAYFKEHGTANLAKNLETLCGSELNYFFSHQCIHGIGHGLMAWTNYEIHEALQNCDLLPERQDSCWTGVFMENTVGSLTQESSGSIGGHFTKYISDDPLYPCAIVDDKYKSSCYFLQTSRMIQIFGADFKKVASSCLDAPKPYQKSCFGSMGRDVGGVYRRDPAGAIKACSFAPAKDQLRIECLMGAVQDSFWDPSGQDEAIRFCRILTNQEEKSACYRTIFERAPQVLLSKNELEGFCKKVEGKYKNICPD